MNQKSPLYDFVKLEAYVRQRQNGQYIAAYEQELSEDEFLQTVVAGIEVRIQELGEEELSTSLALSKQKVWNNLVVQAEAINARPASEAASSSFLQKLQQLWYELQVTQFQYILGFNCTCLLLLLGMYLWIAASPEPVEFFSFVDNDAIPGAVKLGAQ